MSLNYATPNASFLRCFFLAFSWRKNYKILHSDSPKYCISEVIEISGLRVLAMLWILMVHVCTVLYSVSGEKLSNYKCFFFSLISKRYFFSDNKIYKNRPGFNFAQEFINNGSIAFDLHFFLW